VLCLNPCCCRNQSQPHSGCSQWQREPGTDDEPASTWEPPIATQGRRDPHIAHCEAMRDRLDKIYEMSRRANLPKYVYVKAAGRSGLLELSMSPWIKPDEVARHQKELDRLGLNAAINAGRL
jgi:hypothetical protein